MSDNIFHCLRLFLMAVAGLLVFTVSVACQSNSSAPASPTPPFTPPSGERMTTVGFLQNDNFWRDKDAFWLAGCRADISVKVSRASQLKAFSDDGRFHRTVPAALVEVGYPPELQGKARDGSSLCLVMRVRWISTDTYCFSRFPMLAGSKCDPAEKRTLRRFMVVPHPTAAQVWIKEIAQSDMPAMKAHALAE